MHIFLSKTQITLTRSLTHLLTAIYIMLKFFHQFKLSKTEGLNSFLSYNSQ